MRSPMSTLSTIDCTHWMRIGVVMSTGEICTVDECDRNEHAKGLCSMHYYRKRRNGHVDRVRPAYGPICTVDGCDRKHRTRGLCELHRLRLSRNGTVDLLPPPPALRRAQHPGWKDI